MPKDLPDPGSTPTNYQRTTGGKLQWQPPTPEHLAAMLPQYEIEALIGHGGMGAVYKGRQKSLDRTVAIKILPPEAAGDADAQFVERFKNEARTMAKMNHPGIVHVYDFGETSEGQLYIVMEFVDGTDVSKMILSQGKLPPEHALAITAHVCDALYYAHKQNVIHRDIKPANIMINMEGTVKVADFGLAKANDPTQSGLTKTNMAMGTPDFVAPEALTPGMTVDGRADLYAVGVMLYQMLTGSIPRGMWTMPSAMLKTDPRFDAIISRSMQTDREARYQSAVEIRRDLDVILSTPQATPQPAKKPAAPAPGRRVSPNAEPPPPSKSAQPSAPAKKSKTPLLIGLGAAAALALGAFFMNSGSRQTSEKPSSAFTAPLSQAPVKAPEKPAPSQPKPTSKPAESPAVAVSSPPSDALVFAGHRYQLVMDRLIWKKAKEKAEEMGGHLAVIDTKEKLDWVWDTFGSKLGKTAADKGSSRIYIGLQIPTGEDDWEWVTGSPLKVQSWMGLLPETKEGTGYVATIYDHSFDYVRPKIFPPAAFLVEWDDDGSTSPAAAATPAPMPAVVTDKKPPAPPPATAIMTDHSRSADLIPLVDAQRDVVSDSTTGANVWKKGKSSLIFADAEKAGRIAAPVSLAAARAFEIELLWRRRVMTIPGAKTADSGYIALDVPVSAGRWVRVEVARAGDKVSAGGKRIGFTGPGTQNKEGMRIIVRSQDDKLSVIINGNLIGSIIGLAGHAEAALGEHSIFKSELLPAVYCARGDHEIAEWTVRALDGEERLLWEPSLLQDPRIKQLESGYQTRYITDAQKPHDTALAALNQSYITNGISRARASAQSKGALTEITALDDEKAAIEKGRGVPAEDAADTPESLKALRTTYRTAAAKIIAERDAKAAPLLDIYLKALDAYVTELTKAGKIKEASQVRILREITTQSSKKAAAPQ